MKISKNPYLNKEVSFKGYKKSLDNSGWDVHKFYYPYDTDKYNGEVEIYTIQQDKKGQFSLADGKPVASFILDSNGSSSEVDMDDYIDSDLGFAYRFKLVDKNNASNVKYAFDQGVTIGIFNPNNSDDKYNVVLNNNAIINKASKMQLIMPDEYYPEAVKNPDGTFSIDQAVKSKILPSVRTHANKLGGSFDGIMAKLDTLQQEGYTRLVGMPYTKDSISSHCYWTENAYQVNSQFGGLKKFKEFQEQLFTHGINWIADAALVNEGLNGVHFSNLLRKGEQSPYRNWFKATTPEKIGIIPEKTDNVRVKFINSPYEISNDNELVKNKNYNPYDKTIIQFYDDRLVSNQQLASDKPFSTYDKLNVEDESYAITSHNDFIFPYSFEVNADELVQNLKDVSSQSDNKVDLSNISTMKDVMKFSNFSIVSKPDAESFELWDGNVDIAKLNFYYGNMDQERLDKLNPNEFESEFSDIKRSILGVQDYAIGSGKYWTKLSNDTMVSYTAKLLQSVPQNTEDYAKTIKKLVLQKKLPPNTMDVINNEVIENVLNGNYNQRQITTADMRASFNPDGQSYDYTLDDYILKNIMNVPLETMPFDNDILGVLTSPFIIRHAETSEQLGASKYDLYVLGDSEEIPIEEKNTRKLADNLYTQSILPFVKQVFPAENMVYEDGTVNDLGKYVINEIAPDLLTYAIIKGLDPQAEIQISEDGIFDFSEVDTSHLNLKSLNITTNNLSAEEEAKKLLEVISNGISGISEKEKSQIKKSLSNRYNNVNENAYKMAEAIVDRTESGLGWRIDAAKDIASIDSVRSTYDSIGEAWDNVIDFWKAFNISVRNSNPHAYTTAEITDLGQLFDNKPSGRFNDQNDAEVKFLNDTGITSFANYNYYFSMLPELYMQNSIETGSNNASCRDERTNELRQKFDEGWPGNPGFLYQGSPDSVIHAYNFLDNHDKPRILHCLALDMRLFHSDFNGDAWHRDVASSVLKKSIADINFGDVSGKAIAMGSRINEAIYRVIENKYPNSSQIIDALTSSVADLASGNFKGKKFNSEIFGVRPFEIVLDNVIENALYTGKITTDKVKTEKAENSAIYMSDEDIKNFKANALENILKPSFDRFYSMYKAMVALPGAPTDFAGDKLGASGYETKSKNYYQQNRNVIHWDWLKDNSYSFVKDFYNNVNSILELRSRPELSALNDGYTVTIPQQWNNNTQCLFRYNDKGSMIIELFNNKGANEENNKMMRTPTEHTMLSELVLNPEGNAKQTLKLGLKPGMIFKNANSEDKSTYKVVYDNGLYKIKKFTSDGKQLDFSMKKSDHNALILYKVS